MELRHLKYFLAVAEELHFSKAAKRLQMSQPPLSQQIKYLEDYLEVSLFDRTQRRVELTDAGRVFMERSYNILNLINSAEEEVKRVQKGEIGQLILGFTGSVTFDLLPKILRSYRKKYPDVHVILRQLASSEQITALNEDTIHVGLLVSPIENSNLVIEELRKEEFLVVLPKNHWLAQKGLINPTDLKNESFIMTPRKAGPAYYDSTISFLRGYGISPKISLEAQELYTITSLVASGLGIALLPESIYLLKNPEVVYKKLKASFTTTVSVAYNKEFSSPLISSFVRLVKENFQEF